MFYAICAQEKTAAIRAIRNKINAINWRSLSSEIRETAAAAQRNGGRPTWTTAAVAADAATAPTANRTTSICPAAVGRAHRPRPRPVACRRPTRRSTAGIAPRSPLISYTSWNGRSRSLTTRTCTAAKSSPWRSTCRKSGFRWVPRRFFSFYTPIYIYIYSLYRYIFYVSMPKCLYEVMRTLTPSTLDKSNSRRRFQIPVILWYSNARHFCCSPHFGILTM